MLRSAAALIAGLFVLSAPAQSQTLQSSVLPNARVVANDETATVLMTVLNSGQTDATNCTVASSARGSTLSDLHWTQLVAGVPTGAQDAPFFVPAGGRTDLVIASTDSGSTYTVGLRAVCDGGVESPVYTGVNTVTLTFRNSSSDILPVIATLSGDGVIRFNPATRRAVFAVSAVNIGVERNVRVSGRSIGLLDEPTLSTQICETDASGVCLSARTATVDVTLGATPRFFSVAVTAQEGDGIPFFPQLIRYELQFEDQTNFSRATTTAALYLPLQTYDPAFANWPDGVYRLSARNADDVTGSNVSPGYLVIGNEEVAASFTQERTVEFIRQTFDQVVTFDSLSFTRLPTDCGVNGTPLPEGCRIQMTGSARALDTGNGDAGSFTVRCDFDRDNGARCRFTPVASSDISRPSVDIPSDIVALGGGFSLVGEGAIPGGLEGLDVSRFFRDITGIGDSAIVSTGAARSGDQYLSPELRGQGAIARDISFTFEGCTITGYIYFFPATKPDGTPMVAVGGRISAASCEEGAAGAAFWGDYQFTMRGHVLQISSGVFSAYTHTYSNAADVGIFTSFGLSTP